MRASRAAATKKKEIAGMDRMSKGELQQRHERLKNLQFVALSAASFQRKPREELRPAATSASAASSLHPGIGAAQGWRAARRKVEPGR